MDQLLDRRGIPFPSLAVAGLEAIGESIRLARYRRGWTQAQLGQTIGVHQSTISRLENGRLAGMRWKQFASLIGALEGAWPAHVSPFTGALPGWDRFR